MTNINSLRVVANSVESTVGTPQMETDPDFMSDVKDLAVAARTLADLDDYLYSLLPTGATKVSIASVFALIENGLKK